jgi:RHS repeat-associated protein
LDAPEDHAPGMGVTYYGYRWYDPVTGRWPSRDPIGERGGMNLYAFIMNKVVTSIDYLGLATVAVYDGSDDGGKSAAQTKEQKKKCRNKANGKDFERGANDPSEGNDHLIDASSLGEMLSGLERLKMGGVKITTINIYDHGPGKGLGGGIQYVGNDSFTPFDNETISRLAALIEKDGELVMKGCGVADGQNTGFPADGNAAMGWFMQMLANRLGRKVTAWTGDTGYRRYTFGCFCVCMMRGDKVTFFPNDWDPFVDPPVVPKPPDPVPGIRWPGDLPPIPGMPWPMNPSNF